MNITLFEEFEAGIQNMLDPDDWQITTRGAFSMGGKRKRLADATPEERELVIREVKQRAGNVLATTTQLPDLIADWSDEEVAERLDASPGEVPYLRAHASLFWTLHQYVLLRTYIDVNSPTIGNLVGELADHDDAQVITFGDEDEPPVDIAEVVELITR